jgi:hypothetical protein
VRCVDSIRQLLQSNVQVGGGQHLVSFSRCAWSNSLGTLWTVVLALGALGPDVQVQGAACEAIRQLLQEDVQVGATSFKSVMAQSHAQAGGLNAISQLDVGPLSHPKVCCRLQGKASMKAVQLSQYLAVVTKPPAATITSYVPDTFYCSTAPAGQVISGSCAAGR